MNKQPRINNDNTANHQHQHHNTVNHKHQHHNIVIHQYQHHKVNHQYQHHKVNHQYQRQQQQQNQYQLSSYPHQQPIKQLHQLPVQQSQQSDEDQDILQKIDSLLLQNQSQSNHLQNQQNKYAQRQMLLNFKITQLQKIINNLNSTNKKLKTQLDNYHHQEQSNKFINQNNNSNQQVTNSNNNILNCSSSSQSPYNDQLTQMQGQFQQIQHLISQYKQQLAVSEKKWITIKEQKDQQIQSLKKQLIDLSQSKDIVQGQIQKISEENQMLKNKNQQLLIEIQNLQIQLENNKRQQQQYLQQQYIPIQQHFPQQQLSPRYTQRKHDQLFQDYRFNQKIQRQMQTMIKKLLKQLSNQKKINSKMTIEIKRLNGEVIQLQRKIKLKNDAIYQLQMKIINIEKHYNNLTARNNMGNVDRNYVNNVMNTNRINSNHSKNTPLTLTPSQNKNQSSKIKFHNNTINKYQPVNNRINNNIQQQIKFKHKQQITMNQYYQPNQYTDQSDKNYDDYVLTSLPFKGSHSPPKNQSQIQQNLISNNSINVSTSASKFPQSHNFIKPKKIQNKSKNTNISAYQQRSQNDKSLNKQFMAFTLMQLEQGKIKITMKQKIIIISKLIEVYCKKIKSQNYQNLSAQQIQVYNFNDKHPNLVRIRVINGGSKTDISTGVHEQNEESLMYNLAFIVESLVKDVQTIDRQDLQVDLNLSDIIEEILGKNMEQKIAYFQQLSRSLENSVVNLM